MGENKDQSARATPPDNATLERDITTWWTATCESVSQPRFRPASVSGEAHRCRPKSSRKHSIHNHEKHIPADFGTVFGTTVHEAIGRVLRDPALSASEAVARVALRTGLTEHVEEAADGCDPRPARATFGRTSATAGSTLQIEYPIAAAADGGLLLGGYIDLLCATDPRLDLIDFKTDQPPTGNLSIKRILSTSLRFRHTGAFSTPPSCWAPGGSDADSCSQRMGVCGGSLPLLSPERIGRIRRVAILAKLTESVDANPHRAKPAVNSSSSTTATRTGRSFATCTTGARSPRRSTSPPATSRSARSWPSTDEWQKLDKIRILMGDEVSQRTEEAVLGRRSKRVDEASRRQPRGREGAESTFLHGVPGDRRGDSVRARSNAASTARTSSTPRPTSPTPSSRSSARRRSSARPTSPTRA